MFSKAIFIYIFFSFQALLYAESLFEIPLIFDSKVATQCLLENYNMLESKEQNSINFRDNQTLIWNLTPDDITPLKDKEALQTQKLIDSFVFPYPLGNFAKKPFEDSSRIRDIVFFSHIYGASEAEVKQHLKPLIWLDNTEILFNTQNGAYDALKRVKNRLEHLIASNPPLKIYLQNIGGTFKWRKIAGSQNLSAHSFGIAIDINVAHSRYWLWDLKKHALNDSQSVATIPLEIIEAFESENFIWGGRWWHYDTMHFEYRPEILCYTKAVWDSK